MTAQPATNPLARPSSSAMTPEAAWQLAEGIQVTPADGDYGHHLGAVTARPHPTGWFISARARPDLSDIESEQFRSFVVLRTYLLLTQGPQPQVWEPMDGGGWAAYPAEELVELEPTELIPDTVPAGWC